MDINTRLHRLLDDALGQDPRRALLAYRQLSKEHLPWIEQRIVALARREGWSWGRMARLLGCTRQRLHQQFRHLPPSLPHDPDVDQQIERRAFNRTLDAIRSGRTADNGYGNGYGYGSDDDVVPW